MKPAGSIARRRPRRTAPRRRQTVPPPRPPPGELLIRNRQRTRAVHVPFLRQLTRDVLARQPGLESFMLGLHLVGAAEMASVNETYLNHTGPTDVITFDHTAEPGGRRLFGEVFLCVDEAVRQARRFRTTWPAELVRYVIHGILHLRGYDDLTPGARRRMKRAEDRLVRELARHQPLSRLARPARVAR